MSVAEPSDDRTGWAGVLIAAAIVLAHAVILVQRGHLYDIDRLTYWLPSAAALRDAWAAGDWPLWAPGMWAGFPLHAEGQTGFFSPLKLGHLVASDAVGALDIEQVLGLIVCALGGSGAARVLGRTAPGAAAAGVVWALGGALLAWQANPGIVATHALLPLALALALRQRWLGLAVALAFALLAGHPYAYALTIAAAGVAWLVGGPERLPLRGRVAWGIAALTLALALGAVQWLPTVDLVLRSDRLHGGAETARANQINAVALSDLRHWVVPWIDQRVRYSVESGVLTYLGLPALVLALVGARDAARERAGRVVLALGVGALAVALLASAAGSALSEIPLLRLVRGPSKLLFLVFAAVALLVARGVDRLRGVHPAAAWIAVVVIAFDLGFYAQRHADPIDRAALREVPALAQILPPHARLRVLGVESPWGTELPANPADQVAFLRRANPLDANQGLRHGFSQLEGYSPLMAPRSLAFARSFAPRRLRRGGVTHVVTGPGRRLPPPFAPLVETERWSLFGVPGSRPLAFVTPSARSAPDAVSALALADRTPLGTVVVEGARELPTGKPALSPVTVARWSPTRIELHTALSERAVVAVADAWDPGWFATVDGRRVEVVPVDGAFKGVIAPAGTRRVTFVYSPGAFRLGLGVTGWAAVVLLVVLLFRVRR